MTSATVKIPAVRILSDDIRQSGRRGGKDNGPLTNIRSGIAAKLYFRIMLIMLAYAFSGGMRVAAAGHHESLEYLVKAAFLYNFARFVDWPADSFKDPQSPFEICILGKDPFGKALDSIKNKAVKGRAMRIRMCRTMGEVGGCHLLFISASEKRNLNPILNALKNSNTLTVSEMEMFAQSGGMINFIMVGNKVHFEINPEAAEAHQLKISSQILKLARIVSSQTRGKE